MRKAITICTDCKYLKIDGPKDSTWSYKCTHPKSTGEPAKDPVTGQQTYLQANSTEEEPSFSDDQYLSCIYINEGDCKLFESS